MPFLRRVTAGRGIPDERLPDVAAPLLARRREQPDQRPEPGPLAALAAELKERDVEDPGPLGEPQLGAVPRRRLPATRRRGLRRLSSSRPAPIRRTPAAGSIARTSPLRSPRPKRAAWSARDKVGPYTSGPASRRTPASWSMRSAVADVARRRARAALRHPLGPRRAWTTHPGRGTGRDALPGAARRSVRRSRPRSCHARAGDLHAVVYCSRSGPPTQPWLEPDVNDRLKELGGDGAGWWSSRRVGFVSDHMEVVFDLDTEAAETAERLGLAAGPGAHGRDRRGLRRRPGRPARGTRRGGPGRRGPVGTGRPSLRVPRGLLPEPATGPPGPLWE